MNTETYDVIIIGAGLSGIGAAYHLQKNCPQKSYAILEAREAIGGTWDLFRYPGIRSDSDMHTLGYSFRPWEDAKAIADGPSILEYVRKTARDHGIDGKIRFQHRVISAEWSSAEALWTITVERGAQRERAQIRCNFIMSCSGYYDYEKGYTPDFAGTENFRGQIVHPQKWPENLDYSGKRVVVIGSGATAVTLVPAMTDKAAQVTMLQRSPTYVVSLPARDAIANTLRKWLPSKLAYSIARWKNILFGIFFYRLCKKSPELVKKMVLGALRKQLGADYVAQHFTPSYKPWDQRMCVVPDSDMFRAIRKGRAAVVTDHIDRFTETGILLKSGQELPADIVVTATGLNLVALGGMTISVDGQPIDLSKSLNYRGTMCSGVPNLAVAIGYTNASWTLKCDLTCEYVCRLLNYMDAHGYRQCLPRNDDPSIGAEPLIDFNSGYVLRAIEKFPKQGTRTPWKLHQNYARDILDLKYSKVDDGMLRFSRKAA